MRRFVRGAPLAALAVAALALALLAERRGWLARPSEFPAELTQPLRVEITAPAAYRELLIALRVHHYRPQPRSQGRFRDVYFDTPGWDLARAGCSYRFRERLEGTGGPKYALRLERDAGPAPAGAEPIEIAQDLPDELGAAIAAGDFRRALLEAGLEPAERLRALLRELGVDASALAPRLAAQLERERLDVSDKGRNWFALEHEAWSFRLLDGGAGAAPVAFEDVVIDTRLGRADPELRRRVRSMRQLVTMIGGVRPLDRAPHERALAALAPSR